MDRNLSSSSIFDMGLLAQSVMLAAQEYQVDSAPAFLFASYPDLVRAELDIPQICQSSSDWHLGTPIRTTRRTGTEALGGQFRTSFTARVFSAENQKHF